MESLNRQSGIPSGEQTSLHVGHEGQDEVVGMRSDSQTELGIELKK